MSLLRNAKPRVVPCGSCTVCCQVSWVVLRPEDGDVPELYETVDVVHPQTGAPAKALRHKPEGGGCIYLTEVGCGIHAHRPALCREFDCRDYYTKMMAKPRAVRKQELRDQYSAKELFEAGRAMQAAHPIDE